MARCSEPVHNILLERLDGIAALCAYLVVGPPRVASRGMDPTTALSPSSFSRSFGPCRHGRSGVVVSSVLRDTPLDSADLRGEESLHHPPFS